jgi:hypothetical protein
MNVNEHFIVRSITKKLEFLEVPLRETIAQFINQATKHLFAASAIAAIDILSHVD